MKRKQPAIEKYDEIEINVTQEDIDAGIALECERCPIALATNRSVPGARAIVGDEGILITPREYAMPREAHDFMGDFDSGKPVKPFRFTATLVVDGTTP